MGEVTGWHYYHFDELGSTRLLTDSSGNVSDKYSYDAYGKLLWHEKVNANSISQPYQYVGRLGYYTHYQEPDFGLLQLGARFYDAETARFTQRDSIVRHTEGGHVYSADKPTRYIDPSGLMPTLSPLYASQCVCDRRFSCMQKWYNWWTRNYPWDKQHNPPAFGDPGHDKVGHCFVTCKAMKDCGMSRKDVLQMGALKECMDGLLKDGADTDDMAANKIGADIAARSGSDCLHDCVNYLINVEPGVR
ncbi:MAG: RHS repeat domain-containing protein [Armatimonadota bacterium]